jgi:hypothetical protein
MAKAWSVDLLTLDNQGLVDGDGGIFHELTDQAGGAGRGGTGDRGEWLPWNVEWGAGLRRAVPDPALFRTAWPDEPLSGGGMDYRTLFDLETLVALVDRERVPPASVRVVREGRALDERVFTRDDRLGHRAFGGRLDRAVIAEAVAAQGTLAIQGLEGHHEPARRLCADVSRDLGCMVTSTAFYSSPSSPGFPPHFDTHHVLLLQIAGAKEWHLSPPPFDDPLIEHTSTELEARDPAFTLIPHGTPSRTHRLTAGSYLWIPRGWVHEGRSSADGSLHVTLGITPLDHMWLMHQLVDDLRERRAFRQYLPPGSAPGAVEAALASFTAELRSAVSQVDTTATARRIRDYVRFAGAQQPARFLRASLTQPDAGEPARYRVNHSAVAAWRCVDGLVELHCGDRVARLPGTAEALLEALRHADHVRTADFAALAPDDPDGHARFLTRIGLIEEPA